MLSNVMHKIQSALASQPSTQGLGWMSTLQGQGELDALVEIKNRLVKIEFTETKNLQNKINLVLEIDKKTYASVKKITHNYLTSLKLNRDLQNTTQATVYEYQRQLYVAYTQFLDLYQNQSKLILSQEKINLILARYLNATFTMTKWRYFDDQPAPHGTWDNVHKIIRYAENLAIMNKNIFLYDFQVKETSIATILKRGFMLDTLQKGNFSRLQIQLTEQVLKIWGTNPLIVNKYKQGRYQFFIMLHDDHGPERVRAVEKFSECRYWKTTRLVELIEDYLLAVNTQKPLAKFGLEKMAPPSVTVKLFKKLRIEWCVEGYTRQRRRETRNRNSKLLNVSHGLYDICHRLNIFQAKRIPATPVDASFAFELKVAMHNRAAIAPKKQLNAVGSENWWMVDESASGFAVDLGKVVNDWVDVGKLIGYTTPEEKNIFFIAEIRSLRKQSNGTYRAGIELITKNAVSLQISRVKIGDLSEAITDYYVDNTGINLTHLSTFFGLYIKNDDPSGTETLILPRSEFKRDHQYQIQVDREEKIVAAKRVVNKQRDWIQIEVTG